MRERSRLHRKGMLDIMGDRERPEIVKVREGVVLYKRGRRPGRGKKEV